MIFTKALTQKRWTCIEGHVRMNTPAGNGLIEAWMDTAVFWKDGLLRRPGSVGIREMWNNAYLGVIPRRTDSVSYSMRSW